MRSGSLAPFNMRTAPVARGFFVSDYEGLGVHEDTLLPFFSMANSGNLNNRTDTFAALRGEDADTSGIDGQEVNLNPQSVAELITAHREINRGH